MLKIKLRDRIQKVIEKEDQKKENYREFTSLETKEERIDRVTSIYKVACIFSVLIGFVGFITLILYFFVLPPIPIKTGTRINPAQTPKGILVITCAFLITSFFGAMILYAINMRVKTYKILKERYSEKKGEPPKLSVWSYAIGDHTF